MKINKADYPEIKMLIEQLKLLKTDDDLYDLFVGFLTIGEIKEIGKRIKIIQMLKKGVPHKEIAKKLEVGVATVTRGSREIKNGRFKYIK